MPPMPPPPGTAGAFLLRGFSDHGLGGDHQAGHGGGILQRRAGHLGGVQDAHSHQVAVLAGGGVVAVVAGALGHLVHDHGGLITGVGHDLAQGLFHGPAGDVDTHVLVVVGALEAFDGLQGTHQGDAAAGHDALFHRGAGGVQGVFHPRLLLFHLHFGGGTDLDHGHAAGELGDPLLQLLLVVVGGGLFDLNPDLLDTGLDVRLGAGAVDQGGVFLGDQDLLGVAQLVEGGLLQRQAHLLGDHRGAGEDGDVLQHGLAPITEARGP